MPVTKPFAIFFTCGIAIFAQVKPTTTTGTTGTAGTPGTTPTTTMPSRTTTTNTNNTNSNTSPGFSIPRPIYISGKVQVTGGAPLPTGVIIERVCGTGVRAVAYTDNKGRFQFEWGRNNGMMPDASVSDTRGFGDSRMGSSISSSSPNSSGSLSAGESDMMTCDIRASAPGYRSDSISLAGRRSLDNPDIGMILLHRLANVEGTSISATSLAAPKDSKKAFEKGMDSVRKQKFDDAAKSFEKAVEGYPKFADAWYQLGRIRSNADRNDTAREAFRNALQADPKLVGPGIELGLMSFREKKWEEATSYLDRAVKLDPVDYPNAWFATAVAHFNLKQFDVAEKSAREAVKTDFKHLNPRAGYLLGLVLAEKGVLDAATAQLKEYLLTPLDPKELAMVMKQLAQLEKLASAKVQGPGQQQ